MKKVLFRVIMLAAVGGGAWYGYSFFKNLPSRQETIPTTKVRQGDVIVRSFTRGELRAVRSATLTAPNLFGTVQVTRLAPLGAFAREKDLVVEFDDSEVISRLEEKQLELEQIDEQIRKASADLEMRSNQDQVDLLSARYAVRRAELEVQKNPLLAEIDQKKNKLNLDESQRRLKQLESDIKSRQEQAIAQLDTLREQKNKGNLELSRERQRLSQVKLLAPISGLVAMRQNRTGFMFPGMQIPDIREGDQIQPGIPVADVLDLSEMEVLAKVGELDRANLREGQDATLVLDALPEKKLRGTIKSMSGTASANVFSFDPAKKFDVVFGIEMKELLAALGAKPDQIQKILATAEANRKKPHANAPNPSMPGGMAGGMPEAPAGAPGMPAMVMRTPGPAQPPAAGDPRAPRSTGSVATTGAAAAKGTSPATPGAPRTFELTKGPGGASKGGQPPMIFTGTPQFSEKELANAKLPPPPEEDTQFDVLLRPGLLADVEIIVEKVPNALNVPMQSVFDREGKMVVYVRNGSQWEPRIIKPLKRSESTMVISSGVKVGEVIALADPVAKKSDKKKDKSDKGGGAMSALPGGGN